MIPHFQLIKNVDDIIQVNEYPPRDGDHAYEYRARFRDNIEELNSHGYHLVTPFSEHHIQIEYTGLCSIYNALAPDLLHQVSKISLITSIK